MEERKQMKKTEANGNKMKQIETNGNKRKQTEKIRKQTVEKRTSLNFHWTLKDKSLGGHIYPLLPI